MQCLLFDPLFITEAVTEQWWQALGLVQREKSQPIRSTINLNELLWQQSDSIYILCKQLWSLKSWLCTNYFIIRGERHKMSRHVFTLCLTWASEIAKGEWLTLQMETEDKVWCRVALYICLLGREISFIFFTPLWTRCQFWASLLPCISLICVCQLSSASLSGRKLLIQSRT